MNYHINEGMFTIPASAQDRSVNMLMLNHGPGGLTLVVTRDQMHEGEELEPFVSRQLRTLASQVKKFEQHDKRALQVGAVQLPALQVVTSFRQNGASIHQQQTVLRLDGNSVLMFTLTCAAPLTADQRAYAQQLLDSYTPAPA